MGATSGRSHGGRPPSLAGRTRPVGAATRLGACVLIAVIAALVSWAGLAAGVFTGLQQRASDAVQPRGEAPEDIVVVGIDERSLIDVGEPWPWPRQVHAELIDRIAQGGAEVIAVDVLFAPEADGDEELASAIERAGNVVLTETVKVGGRSSRGLISSELTTRPPDALAEPALGVAQVAVLPDSDDGVVRRVPLVIDSGRELSPALSLATVAALGGGGTGPPVVRPDGVQLGDRAIPTGRDAAMTVSFTPELASQDSDRVVSASAVLDGEVDPSSFRDAVVFVGATDPTLGDHHLAPVAKQGGMAGVLIHANAHATMVAQTYLAPAPVWATVLSVFLLALLAATAIQFLPLRYAPFLLLALLALFVVQAFVQADRGTIPNFVYPAIALAAVVPASIGLRYLLEVRQRRAVAGLFSLYIPEPVADELLRSGLVDEVVAGQRLEIATLFADLRGFTALSAENDPGAVREMLDHYYEFMSEIVLRHHGTLMAYVGDEVFAVFGAPVPDPDLAQHATDCASEMQAERHRLTATLSERGLPDLTFGIGVNVGPAIAAHTGSSFRRQYTVIGDTVNTGSRLCSQAGRNAVVISDAVAERLTAAPEMEHMGSLEMKGVRDDFVAWRLVLPGVVAEDR